MKKLEFILKRQKRGKTEKRKKENIEKIFQGSFMVFKKKLFRAKIMKSNEVFFRLFFKNLAPKLFQKIFVFSRPKEFFELSLKSFNFCGKKNILKQKIML